MDGKSVKQRMRVSHWVVAAWILMIGLEASLAFAEAPVGRFSSEVAVTWFDLLYDRLRSERISPPVASRTIGYTGVALYEAVVPGMPEHQSLGAQLNELGALPGTQPSKKYHWPDVANSALATTLKSLFAGGSADTLARIDALEQEFSSRFQARLKSRTHADSVAHGRAVAEAVIAWVAGDGFTTFNNCSYTPPTGPGLWVPTPPGFRPALQPCWGQLRPFVLVSGEECAPVPPPAYSTDPSSEFFAEGLEVYQTTQDLSAEQIEIARFWSDDPGNTGTPPGHWISITGQIARARGLSLGVVAEAYARVGIAVADSFISCWEAKYDHNLLRPVTYLQATIDPNWMPLLGTPPFPEYTSGHSVQSGAAAWVLTDLFGQINFTDDTHHALGFPARSFSSFNRAAAEAAISRLYGGIHYRAAIDRGVEQGECVGQTVVDHIRWERADRSDD